MAALGVTDTDPTDFSNLQKKLDEMKLDIKLEEPLVEEIDPQ